MNYYDYYDVQISFMAGDRIVNDQILAATWVGTEREKNIQDLRVGYKKGQITLDEYRLELDTINDNAKTNGDILVVICPDGTTIRYNLNKILYWQVRSHETNEKRKERVSRIVYARDDDIFQTDYSKFIKEED